MFGLQQFSNTENIIRQGIENKLHFGAQVYISQDGDVLADFAIGNNHPPHINADKELSTDTIFTLDVLLQMLTAVAIGILAEKTPTHFDQVVGDIIPEFACNGKEEITIWHLLTHTSGIRLLPLQWDKITWEATVEAIAKMPIESGWIPGEKAGYHIGTSWLILGEIVRRLDGRTVDVFLKEEILEPLGMQNSGISISKELTKLRSRHLRTLQNRYPNTLHIFG